MKSGRQYASLAAFKKERKNSKRTKKEVKVKGQEDTAVVQDGKGPEENYTINDINRPFQTGTIRLVSADNLVFRCDRGQLFLSGMFRDMLDNQSLGANGQPFELSDESSEYGRVIALFLHFPFGDMKAQLQKYRKHIFAYAKFIKKWECAAHIEQLVSMLEPRHLGYDLLHIARGNITKCFDVGWAFKVVFGVGVLLDHVDLCYSALRNCHSTEPGPWGFPGKGMYKELDVEIDNAEFNAFITLEYLRAYQEAEKVMKANGREIAAEEFRRLVKEYKKQ